MFRHVGPEWSESLEAEFTEKLRVQFEYAREVNDFIRKHPVGKRFYEHLRDIAIDTALQIVLAPTPDDAKQLIDREFVQLKLANEMLQHFSRALVDGSKAIEQLQNPQPPQPER